MGTHYKGSSKVKASLDLYIKLMRASELLSSKINTLLSEFNLSESQFNILDALYHLGSLSQKELGKKLLKSGGNITMVVDNLEKQNLVKRQRNEKDRRVTLIYLTKNGESLIKKILPKVVKKIAAETNILSESENAEFQRLCKILGMKSSN
jgi:MarR family transcriptional regulator, 2-MHQ and catechol-resistance regulon repressor